MSCFGRIGRVAALAALVALGAGSARAEETKSAGKKKIQEVDLRRLEIEGKLENPSSLFILETEGGVSPAARSLDGLLVGAWIRPVEKRFLEAAVSGVLGTQETSD